MNHNGFPFLGIINVKISLKYFRKPIQAAGEKYMRTMIPGVGSRKKKNRKSARRKRGLG